MNTARELTSEGQSQDRSSLDRSFAVLRLSYNQVGDRAVVGGVCGSAFFISPRVALTARPVLSAEAFGPAEGYSCCQYWLVARGGAVVAVRLDWLRDFPAEQATAVVFPEPQAGVARVRLAEEAPAVGTAITCRGHVAGEMPRLQLRWREDRLALDSAELADHAAAAADWRGAVGAGVRLHVRGEGGRQSHAAGFRLRTDAGGTNAGGTNLGAGASGAAVVAASGGEAVGLVLGTGPGGKDLIAVAAPQLRRSLVYGVIRERAHNIWLERQHRPGEGDSASDWTQAKGEMGFGDEKDM